MWCENVHGTIKSYTTTRQKWEDYSARIQRGEYNVSVMKINEDWLTVHHWHGLSLSNQRCWAWTVRWCVKESSATLSLVLQRWLPHSTILTSRIWKRWHAPLGLFRDDFSTSTWNVDQRWRKGKRTLQWIHRFPLFLENLQTLNAVLFRNFHYPV